MLTLFLLIADISMFYVVCCLLFDNKIKKLQAEEYKKPQRKDMIVHQQGDKVLGKMKYFAEEQELGILNEEERQKFERDKIINEYERIAGD